ncbi:MAG TPA: hypothetical protein VFM43_00290 [Gaiellaceae bacterium]|nr:hypothetical protein [Gaiellaceae bacterium]
MILHPHEFVVLARLRHARGPARRAGSWTVAGVADAEPVAETMAELVMAADPLKEARALSHSELFHKLGGAERERIVELLACRTTADIARSDTLRLTAQAWLDALEAPLSRTDAAEEDSRRSGRQPAQSIS